MSNTPAKPATPADADPSMEDILASIRRILNEDEAPPAKANPQPAEDEVLVLEPSMMVSVGNPAADDVKQEPSPAPEAEPEPKPEPAMPHLDAEAVPEPPILQERPHEEVLHPEEATQAEAHQEPEPQEGAPLDGMHQAMAHQVMEDMTSEPHEAAMPEAASAAGLLAPEAAAAAASSVDTLLRTLSAGRATQVYSGGPTLEDLVRAELRPLLKEWLNANLPPVVERLVRAEIEKVVGRSVPS